MTGATLHQEFPATEPDRLAAIENQLVGILDEIRASQGDGTRDRLAVSLMIAGQHLAEFRAELAAHRESLDAVERAMAYRAEFVKLGRRLEQEGTDEPAAAIVPFLQVVPPAAPALSIARRVQAGAHASMTRLASRARRNVAAVAAVSLLAGAAAVVAAANVEPAVLPRPAIAAAAAALPPPAADALAPSAAAVRLAATPKAEAPTPGQPAMPPVTAHRRRNHHGRILVVPALELGGACYGLLTIKAAGGPVTWTAEPAGPLVLSTRAGTLPAGGSTTIVVSVVHCSAGLALLSVNGVQVVVTWSHPSSKRDTVPGPPLLAAGPSRLTGHRAQDQALVPLRLRFLGHGGPPAADIRDARRDELQAGQDALDSCTVVEVQRRGVGRGEADGVGLGYRCAA